VKNNQKRIRNLLISVGALAVYFVLLRLLVRFETAGDDSNINNFVDAVWYAMVTLTTVGYGDMYPHTFGGQLIGYVFVLASLGVLGFLIGKINTFFTELSENARLGYRGTSFTDHMVIVGWNCFH